MLDLVTNAAQFLANAAILGAMATLSVWAFNRRHEARKSRIERERQREQFLRALYFEIHFNTRDMEIFARKSPDMQKLAEKIKATGT